MKIIKGRKLLLRGTVLNIKMMHVVHWCVFVVSGLAYLCEGLKEQRKGLVTLVLWNNQLTHNGMGYLAAALVQYTQTV